MRGGTRWVLGLVVIAAVLASGYALYSGRVPAAPPAATAHAAAPVTVAGVTVTGDVDVRSGPAVNAT